LGAAGVAIFGRRQPQEKSGYSEIEIFSNDWWGRSMNDVLRTCIARHRTVV